MFNFIVKSLLHSSELNCILLNFHPVMVSNIINLLFIFISFFTDFVFVAVKTSKIIIKLHNLIQKIIFFLQSGHISSQFESSESYLPTDNFLAPEIKHLRIILYRLKNPFRHYSLVDNLHHVRLVIVT